MSAADYVVFTRQQYEDGIAEMAGTISHGGFLTRRAIGDPVEDVVVTPKTAHPLTFAELRAANTSRVARWHHADTEQWTAADWSNALCGEVGELANVIKKIRRHETGTVGDTDPSIEALRSMARDELGDVLAYADLLALFLEIDLAEATACKFNRVSERQGFPERLAG